MNLAKWGAGLGLGMMGLGTLGRITGVGVPKEDPTNAYIQEVSGSLIVFGAVVTILSSCVGEKPRYVGP